MFGDGYKWHFNFRVDELKIDVQPTVGRGGVAWGIVFLVGLLQEHSWEIVILDQESKNSHLCKVKVLNQDLFSFYPTIYFFFIFLYLLINFF